MRARPWALVQAAAAGLLPWLVALARVRAGAAPAPATSPWNGEGAGAGASAAAFVHDIGFGVVALAAFGLTIALRRPEGQARPLAVGLLAVTLLGLSAAWLGAPCGPERFGAPLLAAYGALSVLGAPALLAATLAVSRARVPLARVSAAMVVLLEMVLPVDSADETMSTTAPAKARAAAAAAVWNDMAWARLPPGAVVLVGDPGILDRALSAGAQEQLRADVVVAPLCARCVPPWDALARDRALVGLWRDVQLTGAPTEASLSAVAEERALFTSYDPAWGPAAARHLLPFTVFDRFAPEPRGASDRRQALEAFAPVRDSLAAAISSDPALLRATATLLRARARLLATGPDRALAERAAADARLFVARAPQKRPP